MSERNPPAPPNFEIPDLELEPAVSKRAAPVASARAPAAAARPTPSVGEISLGGDDDDFELIQTGSNVDLAIGTSPQQVQRHLETTDWPNGRTRPPEQLPVDPAEVALVSGYGPAPKNAILAPLYAYQVFSRRRPLKKAISELAAALTEAELGRDTDLMQLALELRPKLETNDAFRRLLEPIREIERLAGDRSAALSEADAGFKAQMARFDSELSELRTAESNAQAVSAEKAGIAAGTEKELRRAEAKHQRIQIEIRGVMNVARQAVGPAGGDMPKAQAAQLLELQARDKAFEPELSHARSKHAAASAALDQADAEVQRLLTQIRQLDRHKKAAANPLEKQLSERAAGVSDVEKQRRAALADVARAALSARGSLQIAEPTLGALRNHDKSVELLALRLETHIRALDSHDHQRVKQGVILALSAVAIVLLSILLKAML